MIAMLMLMLLRVELHSDACRPVDYGQVSEARWEYLLSSGWSGDPTDGAERLYPPGC